MDMEYAQIITLTTLVAGVVALGALLYQFKNNSEALLQRSEAALQQTEAALQRSDEALQQTEAALKRSEAARAREQRRSDEALQQTEEALQRSDEALQQTQAALQRSDEALQQTEAALQRSDEALQQTEAALQRSEEARACEGAEKDEKIRQALFNITADDLQTQSSELIVEYQRLCQLYAVSAVPAVSVPSQDVDQDTRHQVDATR